jgi:thioesterase domain-containing protein
MDVAAMTQALTRALTQSPQADAHPALQETPLVFLLPGIGGDEPRLAALRARLRPAIQMEVVAYPDWTWLLQVPRPGMAAIVNHVVEQIDQAAPGRAVQLAGYSYGCRLAHAVADTLMRQGRAMAGPVLLLDGPAQARDKSIVFGADDAAYSLRERAARWLVRQLVSPGDQGAIRLQALSLVSTLPRTWLAGPFGFYLRKYLGGALLGPAAAKYQPRRLDANAVLYRSEAYSTDDHSLGWAPYWNSVRVIDVLGDHTTMIDRIGLEQVELPQL